MNIIRYDPLKASSYIDLPKDIKNKEACINIQNKKDNKCFLWSILAYLYPIAHGKNPHYVKHYEKYEHELNMDGMEYPVSVKEGTRKFEAQNDISVNVFAVNGKNLIIPARITENKKEKHVNLLYLSNSTNSHYVLIKDMSRLLAQQINKRQNAKFICDYCLHGCTTAKILEKHQERCKEHRAQLTKYPEPGSTLQFTKYEYQHPVDFYVVADMETIQEKITTVTPDPEKSSTTKIANNIPCSASYLIVSTDKNFYHAPRIFKGENCVTEFLDSLQQDVREIKKILHRPIELIMSEEDEQRFQAATSCHICNKTFVRPHCHNEHEDEANCMICIEDLKVDIKVRDHSHLDGAFRSSAHQSCNLNYKVQTKISIFLHNLKAFDSHLILQHVNPKKHGRVTCIPKTTEQYISFTVGDMVFKDSLAFTNKSLDELVKTLKPEQLLLTRRYLENYIDKLSKMQEIPSNHALYEDISSYNAKLEEDSHTDVTMKNGVRKRKHANTNNFLDTEAEASDGEEDVIAVLSDDDDFIHDEDDYHDDPSLYRQFDSTFPPTSKKLKLDHTHCNEDSVKYYKISDLPDHDYRRYPYTSPTLSESQQVEVERKFSLMTQKGVFPYEYITSLSVLNETSLPPQAAFHSSLNDKDIKSEEYARAQHVWKEFNMKTLWHYHDLYLLMDVLLLADVMNEFRDTCLNNYHIDPLHSYTAPGFAWQAALRMTEVNLELLSDEDMYLFFEAAKRGGVSVISHRYAKANIPNQPDYDADLPTAYLTYIDMNNLYGGGMREYLPIGNFQWVNDDLDAILNTPDDSQFGYYGEVDLRYPYHLHNLHNDYPLSPEKIAAPLLSPYQKEMLRQRYKDENPDWTDVQIEEKVQNFKPNEKLIPNLCDKKKYIVHYRLLKYYVSCGLRVSAVHRVLKFQQRPWLRPFIDFNTEMRKAATSDFAKDFFKLLNNAVFGKTLENIREHRNVDLVGTEEKARKLASQPTFRSFNIFHENLFAVERYKSCIEMNKPIYTGVSVLDFSKLMMYRFHYEYIKQKYPDQKSVLCFTDTDSFLYRIETEDIHKDMLENHKHFDFSDYNDNHPIFDGKSREEINHYKIKNKKSIGKMKDELKGDLMLEFVGVRAKVYSYKYETEIFVDENGEEVEKETGHSKISMKTCKKLNGMKKCIVKNKINHEHYTACVLESKRRYETMNTFRSYNHRIYTISQNKLALCNYDDKRFILDDGISTLPHGHYKTQYV